MIGDPVASLGEAVGVPETLAELLSPDWLTAGLDAAFQVSESPM